MYYKIESDVEIDKSFYTFSDILKTMKAGDSFLAPVCDKQSIRKAAKRNKISIKTKTCKDDKLSFRVWRIL
jgi:hypothetical protein